MHLFQKKEVWRLTLLGWLAVFLVVGTLMAGLVSGLYPFLAQNRPVENPELLLIEGWLEDSELERVHAAAAPDVLFVATGGPITLGACLFKEKDYAEITANRLMALGVPAESIITASAPYVAKDRTYASACAAREVLAARGLANRPINLYSLGAHSRRSFLLYRRAFGSDATLGVVSLESETFDLRSWWKSSQAFKHQVNELISWLYVQCTRWRY